MSVSQFLESRSSERDNRANRTDCPSKHFNDTRSRILNVMTLLFVHFCFRCFSCASPDYEPLFSRSRHLRAFWDKPPKFDAICDESLEVRRLAPVENCESTCITVFEPQFFGGVQSVPKPFTFIRGCADEIFSLIDARPREVDFLHQEAICLSLPLSQIWPQVNSNEYVEVGSDLLP
ncbi:hypothetical protein L596_006862 [Steinernema carpocapsae]|uniref:Uncharacterized protein n=1 Tax=Steinernema carpocapsae TaxID=34508 RepID=A0A4U5P764_STECR|nr:hypothetical protein L596_006862 [Steinernema carpocapsae]